jgi:uncharacterized protein
MPVQTSYPGLYFIELPSTVHTIQPAPTSITVFIGYSHPFKTPAAAAGKPTRVAGFLDYEKALGGRFASGDFHPQLPHAVNQFFLNGGSDAYVVGLQPRFRRADGTDLVPNGPIDRASFDPANPPAENTVMNPSARFGAAGGPAIVFFGLEPIDQIPLNVAVVAKRTPIAADTPADIVLSYGQKAEVYRNVTINDPADKNYLLTRINGTSQLVLVAGDAANGLPGQFPAADPPPPPGSPPPPPGANRTMSYAALAGQALGTTFAAGDFTPPFEEDGDLDKVPVFNLMALPGVADNAILSEAIAFCERKYAFLVMDPPQDDSADGGPGGALHTIQDTVDQNLLPRSHNAGLYFPYLRSDDPDTGQELALAPSGFVTGIIARTDTNRGVWKAPAGLETLVNNTLGPVPTGLMTDPRQGILNLKAVNCLREFPGVGTVVYGARTTVAANPAFAQDKYVPVRRMTLWIIQTLKANLTWAVFEPNDEPLWFALRTSIEAYLLSLYRQHAFQGDTPSKAFQVLCDATTTTQQDIDNGIVNIVVKFAPLKPAEFVVVQIAQLAGQAQT